MCSMILSLFFRIMLIVKQFIRLSDVTILSMIFLPHFALLIIFTFVSIFITWCFLAVPAISLLLLCLLPDTLGLNKDTVLLYSIQYCKVHKRITTCREWGWASFWRQVRVPGSGSRARQRPVLSELQPVRLFGHLPGLSWFERSGGQAGREDMPQAGISGRANRWTVLSSC